MTDITAPQPSRLPILRGYRLAEFGVLAFFGLVMALPVTFLLIGSFNLSAPGQPAVYGLSNWVRAFSDTQTLNALLMSFTLSSVRLIPSLLISITVAWLVARTDMPGGNFIEFLCWFAYFVPDFPLTLAWILLLDPHFGFLNMLAMHLPFVDG